MLHLLLSLIELAFMIVISGLIVWVIYRVFIKANPDFDMEREIRRGNLAVGILVGSIMVCAAELIVKGIGASVGNLRLTFSSPSDVVLPLWQAGLLVVGHLGLSLAIALLAISVALRLFGLMTRPLEPEHRMGKMLEKGNIAVGVLLAAVVFIATLYVGEGLSALTKSLVPQPKIGKIQIMK